MIGFEPLISGMAVGGSNEMYRSFATPALVLQAKFRLTTPPEPRQSCQAKLIPPADAREAVNARSTPVRSRIFFIVASRGLQAGQGDEALRSWSIVFPATTT